jgi:multidrug efflux pump subunit AcrB
MLIVISIVINNNVLIFDFYKNVAEEKLEKESFMQLQAGLDQSP